MSDAPDLLQETLRALYGDGAWEISKRAMSDREKSERTQARVGLASNIVGLAAGGAATKAAYDEFRTAGKPPRVPGTALVPGKKLTPLKKVTSWASKNPRKVAAGALALQVGNVAGDAVANRVLARSAKKQVSKSLVAEKKSEYAQKGVNATATALKKAPETAQKVSRFKLTKLGGDEQKAKVITKSVELEVRGEISKMNTELKQVFGWASVIEMNGEPVIDLQGDVMTIDTIEKAAYSYVHGSRKGGRQHERNGEEPLHVSDMIESFVLTPEKKKQMGLPDNVPTGWWVGFQVNDEDTWQQYKDGKLKEFSIHGSGTRKALEL